MSSITDGDDDTEDIIQQICNGDPEIEKKLRILMLEVEVIRQDGRTAPDYLNVSQWENLLEYKSRNQRASYLTYLWKNEKNRENKKAKQKARRRELEETDEEDLKEFPDDLLYGIKHRSLFLRIRDQSINNFDNYRAVRALMHGQSIVIDCSYEEHMVKRETLNAAKQLTFVFGDNRLHKEPFNLHLCNVNKSGVFMEQFRKNVPSIDEPWFPLNIHSESYMNIFPQEKLVYLTPHCRDELTHFDHDAIYIIGCMVDKTVNDPLSLAKAKKDGLKMAKLPLDRYLEWAPGSKKNLNINHMVPILLDLKTTGDWEFALRHIPRRKLMQTKIMAMQKKLQDSSLRHDIDMRSFKNLRVADRNVFKDRRQRSRQSLYDDDEI
ncbi:unnamed protein product [Leptosia nina]|uniref:RNA (guanine-9-)-methyltransferase domain-containing protein 1 n=1 Tax=Leptosia nina TaxID=320188 RepID=A0AAV1ISP1_9NEOP